MNNCRLYYVLIVILNFDFFLSHPHLNNCNNNDWASLVAQG